MLNTQGPFDNSGKFNLQLSQLISWPGRSCSLRMPSGRTWPVWLQVKRADNARTIRQTKGLGPPAGTPRQQLCVFYLQGQQTLASGLNNTSEMRGYSMAFQGLQLGPAAALSCTLDLILQTSPAGPHFRLHMCVLLAFANENWHHGATT